MTHLLIKTCHYMLFIHADIAALTFTQDAYANLRSMLAAVHEPRVDF